MRAALLTAALLAAGAARAQDAFEIQVYTPEVNEPGQVGLELHSNWFASGDRAGAPPELPTHRVLHETLEPSVGLGAGLELGGYLQTALRPDGTFDFAGIKARFKAQLGRLGPWQFALNAELSRVPERYGAERWGSELRPIVYARLGALVLDANPIVTFDWTGPDAGLPQLEPCATALWELGRIALGVEYFGALGPVSSLRPLAQQSHQLFGVVHVLGVPGWELHAGAGAGLTDASPGFVLKAIVGKTF